MQAFAGQVLHTSTEQRTKPSGAFSRNRQWIFARFAPCRPGPVWYTKSGKRPCITHQKRERTGWLIIRNTGGGCCTGGGVGRFMAAGLLFLLVLLGAVGVMWKHLHRDAADTAGHHPAGDHGGQHLEHAADMRPPARSRVQTLSTGTDDGAGLPHGGAAPHRPGGKKLVLHR